MAFDQVFSQVVAVEGGYSNDKDDKGGATRYGITEAVARANGYTGDMRNLPLDLAKRIYRNKYWSPLCLDEIDQINTSLALEIFDTAVNMGVPISGTFLQRALNALNRKGADYPDVAVDGNVGSQTIAALRAYVARRGNTGVRVLSKALNCLQGNRYIEIAEARQGNESFVFGWLENRVTL